MPCRHTAAANYMNDRHLRRRRRRCRLRRWLVGYHFSYCSTNHTRFCVASAHVLVCAACRVFAYKHTLQVAPTGLPACYPSWCTQMERSTTPTSPGQTCGFVRSFVRSFVRFVCSIVSFRRSLALMLLALDPADRPLTLQPLITGSSSTTTSGGGVCRA